MKQLKRQNFTAAQHLVASTKVNEWLYRYYLARKAQDRHYTQKQMADEYEVLLDTLLRWLHDSNPAPAWFYYLCQEDAKKYGLQI